MSVDSSEHAKPSFCLLRRSFSSLCPLLVPSHLQKKEGALLVSEKTGISCFSFQCLLCRRQLMRSLVPTQTHFRSGSPAKKQGQIGRRRLWTRAPRSTPVVMSYHEQRPRNTHHGKRGRGRGRGGGRGRRGGRGRQGGYNWRKHILSPEQRADRDRKREVEDAVLLRAVEQHQKNAVAQDDGLSAQDLGIIERRRRSAEVRYLRPAWARLSRSFYELKDAS
eukprot:scaffold253_cov243-Pinguiococcus_pyrenoidosus.AAC.2